MKFHPNLKFTYEKCKEGRIITDFNCKHTDGYQYLHYDLCSAYHIKRLLIFSQTLRLRRMCSEKNDLNVHVEDPKKWFRKRRYPDYLIKQYVEKTLRLTPSHENNSKKVNGV